MSVNHVTRKQLSGRQANNDEIINILGLHYYSKTQSKLLRAHNTVKNSKTTEAKPLKVHHDSSSTACIGHVDSNEHHLASKWRDPATTAPRDARQKRKEYHPATQKGTGLVSGPKD